MYKVPKQEHVDLKQVKLKDGSVEFKATVTSTDGEEVYHHDLKETYSWPPDPDFVKAVDAMKVPLATMCGLIDAETLVKAKDFVASKKQIEALENYLQFKLADIKVSGVALSGEDGNRGVIITGSYRGQAINSRKTKFTSELNFEENLEELVDLITDETYLYIFQGKKAKLESLLDPDQLVIEKELDQEVGPA